MFGGWVGGGVPDMKPRERWNSPSIVKAARVLKSMPRLTMSLFLLQAHKYEEWARVEADHIDERRIAKSAEFMQKLESN